MKLKQMTNQHLLNAIRYWKRQLACQPDEQVYIGDSEYAEKSVELENEHNRELAKDIANLIGRLETEASNRGLLTTQ